MRKHVEMEIIFTVYSKKNLSYFLVHVVFLMASTRTEVHKKTHNVCGSCLHACFGILDLRILKTCNKKQLVAKYATTASIHYTWENYNQLQQENIEQWSY